MEQANYQRLQAIEIVVYTHRERERANIHCHGIVSTKIGAMTFSITTLSITTFTIVTLRIMALSKLTFSIMTLSIMALSIMTPHSA
jgi:hypothetical protein